MAPVGDRTDIQSVNEAVPSGGGAGDVGSGLGGERDGGVDGAGGAGLVASTTGDGDSSGITVGRVIHSDATTTSTTFVIIKSRTAIGSDCPITYQSPRCQPDATTSTPRCPLRLRSRIGLDTSVDRHGSRDSQLDRATTSTATTAISTATT